MTVEHLGEAVHLGAVGLGDDAHRAAVPDDDGGLVRALGDQRQRLGDRLVGAQLDRGVEDVVALLDPRDDVRDDRDRDVLRDDGEAAATGDRLGHPLAGDGRHVGHHERQRRAGAVGGAQVDVVAAGHRRRAGHHEDVVVGQVVARAWRRGTARGRTLRGPTRRLSPARRPPPAARPTCGRRRPRSCASCRRRAGWRRGR